VVQNAIQWETAVTHQLTTELNEGKQVYSKLEHYEQKVAKLHEKYARLQSGTKAAYNLSDKIQRNQAKLQEVTLQYRECRDRLVRCDELIDHAWMSLYPLVAQLYESDVEYVQEFSAQAADMTQSLESTLREMASAAERLGGSVVQQSREPKKVWNYLYINGPTHLVPSSSAASEEEAKPGSVQESAGSNKPVATTETETTSGPTPHESSGTNDISAISDKEPEYTVSQQHPQQYQGESVIAVRVDDTHEPHGEEDIVVAPSSNPASSADNNTNHQRATPPTPLVRRRADPPDDPPE